MQELLIAAVGTVGIPLLVKQFVDFLRLVRGKDWSGSLTVLTAWVAGVIFITLVAKSQLGSIYSITIGDGANQVTLTLDKLSGATLLLLGLAIGSIAGQVNDFFAARDNTRSSAKPTLLPTNQPPNA